MKSCYQCGKVSRFTNFPTELISISCWRRVNTTSLDVCVIKLSKKCAHMFQVACALKRAKVCNWILIGFVCFRTRFLKFMQIRIFRYVLFMLIVWHLKMLHNLAIAWSVGQRFLFDLSTVYFFRFVIIHTVNRNLHETQCQLLNRTITYRIQFTNATYNHLSYEKTDIKRPRTRFSDIN